MSAWEESWRQTYKDHLTFFSRSFALPPSSGPNVCTRGLTGNFQKWALVISKHPLDSKFWMSFWQTKVISRGKLFWEFIYVFLVALYQLMSVYCFFFLFICCNTKIISDCHSICHNFFGMTNIDVCMIILGSVSVVVPLPQVFVRCHIFFAVLLIHGKTSISLHIWLLLQVCALSGWYCSVWCPIWCPISWPLPCFAVVQPHQVLPEGEGQVIWCLIVIFNVLQVLHPVYDDYSITIFRLSVWCTIIQILIWMGDKRLSQMHLSSYMDSLSSSCLQPSRCEEASRSVRPCWCAGHHRSSSCSGRWRRRWHRSVRFWWGRGECSSRTDAVFW